ncbi:glycosyl transferase related to UDP-glucuronosyltransferase-like protein [Burkholderiales bacterium GJ-E10]|nr:glycosyl transferase related to UDP-glucuronosyltransferase-like protein [Burkholderiales bacterium GJ-E10]
MNILLAWELGGNWGHVARDLPVLPRLQAQDHDVRYAARDATIAASLCASIGIPCVTAPHGAAIRRMPRGLAGYGAILFADGLNDAAMLEGRLSGWMRLFAEHETDVVVSDYAPAALLAARVAGIPSVAVGSGFEIPPDTAELPSFLTDADRYAPARRFSEDLVLFNVNRVLRALGAPPLERLAQVFQGTRNVLTTVAELDHCGARADATYAGPLQDLPGGVAAHWKGTNKPRVLVYLRGATPVIDEVLQALETVGAEVIAVLPDIGRPLRHAHPDLRVFRQPVRFDALLESADLVIASGSGTVTRALLAGIPVLTLPANAEQAMLGRRVEKTGAGMAVRAEGAEGLSDAIHRLLRDASFRTAAEALAAKYAGLGTESAVQTVIDEIHNVSSHHS